MEAEHLTLRHHKGTLYKKMYPMNNKFLSKISCLNEDERRDIMHEVDRYRKVDKLLDYLMKKQNAFYQLIAALKTCMQDGHATAFTLERTKKNKENTIREQKQRENERKLLRNEQMKSKETNNQAKNAKNGNNLETKTKEVPGPSLHCDHSCNQNKVHIDEDNKVKEQLSNQIGRLDLFVKGTAMRRSQVSCESETSTKQVERVEEIVEELETARKELDLRPDLSLVEAVRKRDDVVVNTMQTKYAKTIANLSMNNRRLTKELDEEKSKNSRLEKEIQELRSSQIIKEDSSPEEEIDQDAFFMQEEKLKIDRMGSCTSIATVSKTIKRRDSTVSEKSSHAIIVGKTGASVNIVNCKNVHIHQIG